MHPDWTISKQKYARTLILIVLSEYTYDWYRCMPHDVLKTKLSVVDF